ncbi:MAG: hypothetical protein WC494_02565 [Candidatus Pacearchaeota archaeon]
MDILEKIMELQGQGLSDEEIYQRLRNEGISPKQIYDATNQAKIKTAITSENGFSNQGGEVSQIKDINRDGFTQEAGDYPQNEYAPPQESVQPPERYIDSKQGQDYQNNYYTPAPQTYSSQDYYAPQSNVDTGIISEIAEQIFSEKISELRKEIGDFTSFKNRIQDKVSDIDERLKRIESSIDKIQQAIIEKIGEFGDNTVMIHRDLDNLHGTVSKLMNPLIDNYKELQKLKEK